ncbi:MAG: DUF3987 domain-containing protein [Planctomycetales bacterium]|nr:DUF3987 domain-containing protein [Planctomycetales bacterium]
MLLYCHAGCKFNEITEALGVNPSDLFPPPLLTFDNHARHFNKNALYQPKNRNFVEREHRSFKTIEAAIADLEVALGKHSQRWDYQDADGEHVGSTLRWDINGRKTFRPVSRVEGSWQSCGMPAPRPLYRLGSVNDARVVYICEGEKATDAISSLGLTATTSAQGAASAGQTDWAPLAGKIIHILPDNDEAGREYALDVARRLSALHPKATVKIIELPGLPPKGDAVEFIANCEPQDDGSVRDEIEKLSRDAKPFEESLPQLRQDRFRAFPINVLPSPLNGIVTRAASAIGCDPSFIALPLLSTLGAAIGNSRRLILKGGWEVPPIIWTAIVANSGASKSAGIDISRKPVQEMQNTALKSYRTEVQEYEAQLQDYEHCLRAFQKNGTGKRPVKPEKPIAQRYWCDDVTVEAVAARLQDQPRGLLLIRDELAGWFGGFDRYAGGKGADAPRWLECFGGRSMLVDRKGGEPIAVERAAVCITGSIQPEILKRNLTEANRQNGLAARMLFAFPPRRQKRWTDSQIDEADHTTLKVLLRKLYQLPFAIDSEGNSRPLGLMMTAAAKKQYVAYFDSHNQEMLELSDDLCAAWSKLEEYPARLALIFHCVRVIGCDPTIVDERTVDEISIKSGIELAKWFANEAHRIYALLGEDELEKARRQLLEWIESKGGIITPRDLQQAKKASTSDDAESKLNDLVANGLGIWQQSIPGQKGRPTRRFLLQTTCCDHPLEENCNPAPTAVSCDSA